MAVPSLSALRELSLRLLLRGMKTGPGWLGRQALKNGQIAGLLKTIRDLHADWRQQLYRIMRGSSLSGGDADAVEHWAADLNMPRKPGEAVEEWAARIRSAIQAETSISRAIVTAVKTALDLDVEIFEPWTIQGEASSPVRTTPGTDTNGDPITVTTPSHQAAHGSGWNRRTSRYIVGGTIDIVMRRYDPRIYQVVRNVKAGGVKPYYTFRCERVSVPTTPIAGATAWDRAQAFFEKEVAVVLAKPDSWGSPDIPPLANSGVLGTPLAAQVAYRKYYAVEITPFEAPDYANKPACSPSYAFVNGRHFRLLRPEAVDASNPPHMVYVEITFEGSDHAQTPFRQAGWVVDFTRTPGVSVARTTLTPSQVDLSSAKLLNLIELAPVKRYDVQREVFAQVFDFAEEE